MLDNGYWEELKKFYETDYHGILPRAMDIDFIKEMQNGGSTLLDNERRFDPREVDTWIIATQEMAYDEASSFDDYEDAYGNRRQKDLNDTEMVQLFPHLFDYHESIEEIASYFMWEDINKFKERMKLGDETYVNEAIRLNWDMMLAEIPGVKDVFMF